MTILYYGVNKNNPEDWHGPYATYAEAEFENTERNDGGAEYSVISKIIEDES